MHSYASILLAFAFVLVRGAVIEVTAGGQEINHPPTYRFSGLDGEHLVNLTGFADKVKASGDLETGIGNSVDTLATQLAARLAAAEATIASLNAAVTALQQEWMHYASVLGTYAVQPADYQNGYGDPALDSSNWIRSCTAAQARLGNTTQVILKVVVGTAVDYFRPGGSQTLCTMLQADTEEDKRPMEWSHDMQTWSQPTWWSSSYGGSNNYVKPSGDSRSFIAFFGSSHITGTCCSTSMSVGGVNWNLPFDLYVKRA